MAVERPILTLPAAEAELLRAAYAGAEVILEYGSGGSTVLAAELGKTVFSVESDHDWAQMMRQWFKENPSAGDIDVIWCDIGPTKEWGHPQNHQQWHRYVRYPIEVWTLRDFRQPDVVLVDGRFRAGCALATAYMTKKPVDLYFDDYAQRKNYHVVESYLGQPQITGRMAHFRVLPQTIPPDRLIQVVTLLQRP